MINDAKTTPYKTITTEIKPIVLATFSKRGLLFATFEQSFKLKPRNTNVVEPIIEKLVNIKFFRCLKIFLTLFLNEKDKRFQIIPILSINTLRPGLGALAFIKSAGFSLRYNFTQKKVTKNVDKRIKSDVTNPTGEY